MPTLSAFLGGTPMQFGPSSSDDTNTVTSTAFEPTADALLVVRGKLGSGANAVISVSCTHADAGAWTVYQDVANSGWYERAFIAICRMSAAPGSGTVTVTHAAAFTDKWLWAVIQEATGVDAAPVIQTDTVSFTSGPNASLILPAPSTDGSLICTVITQNNDYGSDGSDITSPGSPFVEELDHSEFGWSSVALGHVAGDGTTDTYTFGGLGGDAGAGVAVEFKAGGASPTDPPDTPGAPIIDAAWNDAVHAVLEAAPADNGSPITGYVWETAPDVAGTPGTWTIVSGQTGRELNAALTGTGWLRVSATNANGTSDPSTATGPVTPAASGDDLMIGAGALGLGSSRVSIVDPA